ncbi:c-type cytochrome [Methylophaga thiooxydans]|uniref:Cytochrome c subfamily n=1 Tax=Methylophaga thiooxydans DMS010 TaxID=637616 RepID=C0N5G2_9GAMM|nr:cytochrome c [Methylophaga thiooxydans]EEF79798.1 Cytochrome c subfamily [Methylophaga thiooxydans DMS010]|mmetsp:Transcript_19366/g.25062  ORF Transcript_19366/g.25062 Transcript_19366/m.25062 type:complete len:106 (+) Transcript_19366:322-639(+)
MKIFAITLATLASLTLAPTSFAAGDAAVGKSKAAVCASCHGADGMALMPAYPNLAGQNEEYLVSALQAYRSKERQGGNAALMHAMAANLSDDDIANLAAYYASLK